MTLLTTEIHRTDTGEIIVFAADQRVSRDGDNAGIRPKIFLIRHHNAGIGYFGMAEIDTNNDRQPMSEWLQDQFPNFCLHDSLGDTAEFLAEQLNGAIPLEIRRQERLGIHLAGFTAEGTAEFWYIRNIDDNGLLTLPDFQAREDYRRRDLQTIGPSQVMIYRNGDIRAHVAAWEAIDNSLGHLLGTPSFKPITTVEDYVKWVRFKMETFARFYETFATESIIGEPIDCFALTAT